MAMRSLLFAVVLLVAGSTRVAQSATKYSITSYVNSTLHAAFASYPVHYNFSLAPSKQPCNRKGICYPATNQTVKGSQAYVWCGFSSTHKSFYTVTSPKNLTTSIMRKSEFFGCGIKNFTTFALCLPIVNSVCDTMTHCKKRTFGLAFEDETCIVVANNGKNATTFSIQVVNTYDTPRYYGVIFIITILSVFGTFAVTMFVINIRREIMRPIHAKSSINLPAFDDAASTAQTPRQPYVKQQSWAQRITPGGTSALLCGGTARVTDGSPDRV